jgi:hypothetical protein
MVAGKISFTEENQTEKYLIILTTNELRKAKTSYFVWERDIWNILPPHKVKEVAIHSPVGLIMLSVFGPE